MKRSESVTQDSWNAWGSLGCEECRCRFDPFHFLFSAYMDDRQRIPMPSPLKGRPGVVLPVGLSAKILLWNAMLDAGLRKADLARKLNLSPSVIDRLLSLTHASRIEQIETALAALGKKLVVGVREAA